MSINITTGDLAAINDVLREIVKDADGATLEEAATMREALYGVIARAKEAQAAMETKLRDELEEAKEPREVDGRVYVMRDDYVDEWLHDEILTGLVTVTSAPDPDGVAPTAKDAAHEAAKAVYETFVSPSTKAKVGSLKFYLGETAPKKMRRRKNKGRKLEVVIVGEDQPDD